MNKGKIKFWLLTTEYPPMSGGGISTYCLHTARMLSQNGYEVTVFIPDDKVADHTIITENEIRLVRFNTDRTGGKKILGHLAGISYEFASIVKAVAGTIGVPDIIEAQDYQGIAYYLLEFKRMLNALPEHRPVLLTLHSPAFLYLEYNKTDTSRFPAFWAGEMEKHAIAGADQLISPTRFLPEAIRPYMNLDQQTIEVIANPFLPQEYGDPQPVRRGRIVYYGKLSPQKGSFELLSYFDKLWKKDHRFELHIVGGEDIVYHPEMKTMGQIVRGRYGNYISDGLLHLHGKVAPDEAYRFVNDAHVVVFPSIVDNLPYVVMEMMSMGKVVLASVQGGQREMIVDGEDGFLFDHEKDDFEEKLLQVMALSNAELASIGREARKSVERLYSYNTIFPKKDALIRRVLQDADGGKKTDYPFLYQQPFRQLPPEGEKDLLSVVIPFYNLGEYIREAVASVKASTYGNIEIIIVNDGSTEDQSNQVLKELEGEGVTVLHKQNEGLSIARNFGARAARGAFLAFLDADDRVGPEYYRLSINVMNRYHNVFFVGCWVQYFQESAKIWPAFIPQPPYLLAHNTLNSSGLVYKKGAFLANGQNDPRLEFGLEDYESVIHLTSKGYNGLVLPEIHFYYRVRNGSFFRKLTRNKLVYSYQYILAKHSAYYNMFAPQIINLITSNGPGYFYEKPTEEITVSVQPSSGRIKSMVVSYVKKHPRLKRLLLNLLAKNK